MSVSKGYRTGKIKKLTLSLEKPRCRFCDACLDLQNPRNSIKKNPSRIITGRALATMKSELPVIRSFLAFYASLFPDTP
jgi:flavoprotein